MHVKHLRHVGLIAGPCLVVALRHEKGSGLDLDPSARLARSVKRGKATSALVFKGEESQYIKDRGRGMPVAERQASRPRLPFLTLLTSHLTSA